MKKQNIREIYSLTQSFITHSGMIGEDGLLNDSCYPERKYFSHESWAASPRFPYEGWYRRTNDGANPSCMSYGFAIVELMNLVKETGELEYVNKAKRLADYVITFQITDPKRPAYGGFGTGELLNDSAHQLPMSLIWLYKQSGCEKYRDSALLCLDNFVLKHHFQRDADGELTGVFFDYYSEERGRFESWGEPERCAHVHLCFAFSLFTAYDLTGNPEYLLAVQRAYDWLMREYHGECLATCNGLKLSPEDPVKVIDLLDRQIVPRYTGYLIHTLLGLYHYTGDKKYLTEAVYCADTILPGQRADGTFPLSLELEKYFPNTQNGAYGYLGGTLHLLYLATGNEKYEHAAIRAVAALKLDQIDNSEMPHQYGGIVRRGGASVLEGVVRPFGYGFVVDTFQTLLNLQGINMLLGKQNYIGGISYTADASIPTKGKVSQKIVEKRLQLA
jgi:hypothetical protein